jgi:putative addiction module CopG family antidote
MRGEAIGTMNVSLPKELQEYIGTEVASGDFASASEAVSAGLRALRDERAERQEMPVLLRSQEGASQGPKDGLGSAA